KTPKPQNPKTPVVVTRGPESLTNKSVNRTTSNLYFLDSSHGCLARREAHLLQHRVCERLEADGRV
ncbi:MAG: hypothetical protein P4M11_08285, partial [Candidatus Pacebacteria bacterium]|nr:hypothetical protein [Candidatus Paceibacterota bacterium]